LLKKTFKSTLRLAFSVAKIVNNLILCKKYYIFFDVYEFLLQQSLKNNDFYKQYLPTRKTRQTSSKEKTSSRQIKNRGYIINK